MSPHKLDSQSIKIAIDRGGTFTDCLGIVDGRKEEIVVKLLSQDPANYADAPIEGIRRILEQATGKTFPRDQKLSTADFPNVSIRMGTTVATNALLERKGERHALLITKGFRDALVIGTQSRPKLFALNIQRPAVLYEDVVEIEERVTIEDYQQNPTPNKESLQRSLESDPYLKRGVSGEVVRILEPLDESSTRKSLQHLYAKGYRSIAVCLVHSYTFQEHEIAVQRIAQEVGFTQISLSSQLLPMIKMTSRGASATADAYLTPVIQRYIEGFRSGFKDELRSENTRCEFMQSDEKCRFTGLRAVLSGPAGGVVGYAGTSFDETDRKPVIGFDMGGTSTDVSRYDGKLEHTFENTISGVTVMAPQLDINTVAAGGGSILFWRHGLFVVGPESAGAHPGPACYRKGGPLTVTDANLFLGRLLPDYFPKIFGPHEDQPLDVEVTRQKFGELADQINTETGQSKSPEEIALGFIQVANESMAKPIRALTEARGYDTSAHNLACFGGAGGQHACAIASSLSIGTVIIHRYSSILSAYGMALADVVNEAQEPASGVLDSTAMRTISQRVAVLRSKVAAALNSDGIDESQITHEVYLNLRYQGTDNTLMIIEPENGDFLAAFVKEHQREFSFTFPGRNILVEDIRVRGVGKSISFAPEAPQKELKSTTSFPIGSDMQDDSSSVYFAVTGQMTTPVFFLNKLQPGSFIQGPAMIIDNTQTIVVEPNATARILSRHVILDVKSSKEQVDDATVVDPIKLSIFGHRFMSVADQMSRMFQKTSVSTNIKERLDFSCAVFSPDGKLVANAPNVPVHLGSMEYAVRYQHEQYGNDLMPGDHVLTNHPLAGGTHLPDITIITPVWDNEGTNVIFYVASRGHHAEIGGIAPGSMPSNSKMLYEEGAMTMGFKVVSSGRFDEEVVRKFLYDQPATYLGCSGTRTYNDNVSDLKAAIAANHKGAQLLGGLVAENTLKVVHFYMNAIKHNAEIAVRKLLKSIGRRNPVQPLKFSDFMDDGTEIRLEIRIDEETGAADFDFTGTGRETFNCLNAPRAIAHSAIIYSLRALIDVEIPLNQGCLAPVNVIIPPGTLLNPSGHAAVCAGNPITSQRITDVVLGAFGACAASQGCCNIISFGMGGIDPKTGIDVPGFGVGETICGGSGAGSTWHGTSGVHVHMTNTRITDAEVYELRYPVILRQFSIRQRSGGAGRFNGGDGVIRELEFRMPLSVSMLSERRVYRPYGLEGGGSGKAGLNLYVKKELDGTERVINIGGKMELEVQPGERILIHT
ncbi:Hydantoinaseoxoprolinase N-terminal [Penicillium angulare]|uniref:Hydantoinaseoxoprolinase N-terminal n=1 Tax=Penicillium angulare TaxID=116970 RepID=A0A9W9K0T2_9EURO|nr:Hydantoinaseoxoprolinase N-terminal [Penicillium angulare]